MLRSNKQGFTLVEVLIALAILAMIVTSTFTIFRSASKSWQKGEVRAERYHSARVAIGRMSKELSSAITEKGSLGNFLGTKDSLKFISYVSTSSGLFELAEVQYWLDAPGKLLMRNVDAEPDFDFSTNDFSDVLSDRVSSLEFLYYNGITWETEWNAALEEEKTLPKAVKIRIKVEPRSGEKEECFEVTSRLKIATP